MSSSQWREKPSSAMTSRAAAVRSAAGTAPEASCCASAKAAMWYWA